MGKDNTFYASLSAPGGLKASFGTYHEGAVEKNYNELSNKPSIERVELIGNKNFSDLGLETMSNMEILTMFNEVFD